MSFKPMPKEVTLALIEHVLYEGEFGGQYGKCGLQHLAKNLITERELRNLVMCLSATNLSYFNKKSEPSVDTYGSKALADEFERAIYGRPCALCKSDLLDPWERNNA